MSVKCSVVGRRGKEGVTGQNGIRGNGSSTSGQQVKRKHSFIAGYLMYAPESEKQILKSMTR